MYLAAEALANALMLGFVYVVLALGLSIIFGVLDIVNFAHGSLMIAGAYVVYLTSRVIDNNSLAALVGIVPAMLILGVFGLVVYYGYLRFFGPGETVRQLFGLVALSGVIEHALLMIFGPSDISLSTEIAYYKVIGLHFNKHYVFAAIVSFVLATAVFIFFHSSKLGLLIRATAANRTVAQMHGVDIQKTFIIALALGFALTGAAGAVIASYYSFGPASGLTFVVIAFLSVVLGGLGSFTGTIIGAFLVSLVQNFVATFGSPQLVNLALFLIFAFVVAFRPEGIMGEK